MKTTMRFLAVVMLLAVTSWQMTMPARASSPTFDITGVWKGNAGEMEIFQENDEVNAILVNKGWAHRIAGRYVTPTKVRMVIIRRTRANGCEATMTVDLNINSANSLSGTAIAAETACGLTAGQTFPDAWTRIL